MFSHSHLPSVKKWCMILGGKGSRLHHRIFSSLERHELKQFLFAPLVVQNDVVTLGRTFDMTFPLVFKCATLQRWVDSQLCWQVLFHNMTQNPLITCDTALLTFCLFNDKEVVKLFVNAACFLRFHIIKFVLIIQGEQVSFGNNITFFCKAVRKVLW